ncbi:MAG: glycine cleavage system protein H [Pirellulaceae bacterium]
MTAGEATPLEFMMGEYRAEFPRDRRYARNHMWAQEIEGVWRFGFTAYAVRLLQDVYFLDWTVEEGARLRASQEIGSIESKKAESDLYAPLPGDLTRFNEALLEDPSAINVDKYGAGWLFEMRIDPSSLLEAEAYIEHLEAVWVIAHRTIKGQMNE